MADEEIGETEVATDEEAAHRSSRGAAPPDAARRLAELEDRPATRDVHLGPVGQRVPPHQRGRVPPGGLRDGQLHLHLGIQTRRWSRAGARQADRGDVQRTRVGHERMDAEALELGADGVVGVRLDVNYYEWGSDTAEFIRWHGVKAEDGRATATIRASRSRRTSPAGFLDAAPDRPRPLGS